MGIEKMSWPGKHEVSYDDERCPECDHLVVFCSVCDVLFCESEVSATWVCPLCCEGQSDPVSVFLRHYEYLPRRRCSDNSFEFPVSAEHRLWLATNEISIKAFNMWKYREWMLKNGSPEMLYDVTLPDDILREITTTHA